MPVLVGGQKGTGWSLCLHWPVCTKIQGLCGMETMLWGLETVYPKSISVAKSCWSSYAGAQGVGELEGMSCAAQGDRHCTGTGQWGELCQGLGTSMGHLGGVHHPPLHVLSCSQPGTLALCHNILLCSSPVPLFSLLGPVFAPTH